MIKVTVWNEYIDEHTNPKGLLIKELYPNGLHHAIADIVKGLGDAVSVRTATLDQPEQGLPDEVLEDTDVLIWWGHKGHAQVSDELAKKVQQRVLYGMGFIALHSAHYSKPFKLLMGTTCDLHWRDDAYERIFCTDPSHPIAEGLPRHFELGVEECYGEFFDVPRPDSVLFQGWFDIGEVFRSGMTWTRGYGKVFYFQPGHETNGAFNNLHIAKIIQNAVKWANPTTLREEQGSIKIEPTLEELRIKG